MGSKVPYLIRGIARNGINYLPCDFGPNLWRVNFREILQGYPLAIFTKIDPSRIWLKIAGKVVIAISSNSTNKIGYFWAHFGPQNSKKSQKRAPPTPKKAGKLKTAISRPFLVQMSWFFAWGFVVTYSVGKISRRPPDHPPALQYFCYLRVERKNLCSLFIFIFESVLYFCYLRVEREQTIKFCALFLFLSLRAYSNIT